MQSFDGGPLRFQTKKTDSTVGRSEQRGPLCIAQPAQPVATPLSDFCVSVFFQVVQKHWLGEVEKLSIF